MGETQRIQLSVPTWHSLPVEEVVAKLEAPGLAGLSNEEAARRLARDGRNVIAAARGVSAWTLLVRQINNPIIYLLLASTAIALWLQKWTDAAVVFGAVVVNALIGFVQELRANRAIEALSQMVPQLATVLRDGRKQSLPAAELVPGDVIELASGDRVPADGRVASAHGLRVDEAALTGESVPVAKELRPVAADASIGDRTSMVFGGTTVSSGTATVLVTATGAATELGRISQLLGQAQEFQTPLTAALARVGRILTVGVIALAALLFGVALVRGYPLGEGLLVTVTLAVATIPEGLPAIISIALAIGVQRMAARRAIVRKLPTVETLGSTTIVCTDKTGTLTRNEMTVQALWTPEGEFALSGVGYEPDGELRTPAGARADAGPEVVALLEAGALCNDASLHREGATWKVAGDPTEIALVVAAWKLGIEQDALRGRWRRRDLVPFESERQWMATLHEDAGGSRRLVVKGAPEVVLSQCRLPQAWKAPAVLAEVERLAARGMRVLAIAQQTGPSVQGSLAEHRLPGELTLLGLQGMIDPPRVEALRAVRACQAAGITVKMITGDHAATAAAIGRELGLVAEGVRAVTGAELARLDDAALPEVALRTNVFARVAPEHKLRLVRALQSRGHVVAMTGDGVNDSPSLKQANVGVAMGITGTAAAKEASDIVLADDNFATIQAAVEEGRRIYDNLVKALAFVLPTNLGLGLILTAAVFFFPVEQVEEKLVPLLPMMPAQLLWVNLVASVLLALPLAFEVAERNVMDRPPREPHAPVLSAFVLGRTVLAATLMAGAAIALFLWEYWTEVGRVGSEQALREAQTMAVTTVVLFQVFYLVNCRSLKESAFHIGFFKNRAVFVGIGLLLALQALFIYAPFMQTVFSTAALQPRALALAAAVAWVIVPVVTVEKWLRSRSSRRKARREQAVRALRPVRQEG